MSYDRLLTRLYNTPLFLDASKIDIITSNVTIPLLLGENPNDEDVKSKQRLENSTKIPIVEIFGSLVSKNGAGMSGYMGYSERQRGILRLIEQGYKTIGFYVGSHGGEAGGLFGFTDFIANLPKKYGVSTFSFTDDYATSAAYAILVSTQRSYATSTAFIASIGAVMSLIDATKADKKQGLKYHILRSKETKALGNPHEVVTAEILKGFETKLMAMDAIFNQKVLEYKTNLGLSAIIQTKGDSFIAGDALELGLIDEIVTSLDEVVEIESKNLSKKSKPRKQTSLTNFGVSMTEEELEQKLEVAQTKIATCNAEIATLKAENAQSQADATTAERTRCVAVLKSGETLKISTEQVNKRILAGTTEADSLDIFTAIAEAVGNETLIDTTTETQSTVQTTISESDLELEDMKVSASDIVNSVKPKKEAA